MKTNRGRDPSLLAVLGLLLFSGCGTNQDPSFVENRRTTKVDLTVNDEDATAVEANGEEETSSPQQSADHLSSMDDQDVDDIFQSLGSSDGTETSDATVSGNGSEEASAGGDAEVLADTSTENTETEGTSSTKKEGKNSHDSDSTSGTNGEETLADNSSTSDSSGSGSGGDGNTETTTTGSESAGEGGDGDSDLQKPNPAEIKACAKLNGVGTKAVKVVGNKGSASISSNSVVAIKVAGNQSSLDLSLNGSGSVAAICIFVTGNRGTADVTLGVGLGNFIYVGRGNSSTGNIKVVEGGSIANIAADLAGNGASLSVQSQGRANCGAARIHGKGSSFSCN